MKKNIQLKPLHCLQVVVLTLICGALALGQLQRLELSFGAIYIHDFLITMYIGLYFITPSHVKSVVPLLASSIKSYKLIFLSIVCLTISTLVAAYSSNDFVPLLYIFRLTSYSFFIFTIYKTASLEVNKKLWLITISLFAYLGLLQYVFIPDTRILAILGWDDHYYRLIGTLFDPSFTGLVLVLAILYTLITQTLKPVLKTTFLIFFSTCLGLTFSRSSWLALGVGLLYITLKAVYRDKNVRSSMWSFLVCVVILCSILLAPKPGGEGVNIMRTSTIDARHVSFQNVVANMNTKTLLIGNGLFQSPARATTANPVPYHPRVPDNFILTLLYGGGVIAMTTGLLGITGVLKSNVSQNTLKVSIILAVLTHSLFNASFLQPFIYIFALWLYTVSENE